MEVSGQLYALATLSPRTGDRVGQKAGLGNYGEENISCPQRDTNPGPAASCYTHYAIPTPLSKDSSIYGLKMTKIQNRSLLGTSDRLLNSHDVALTHSNTLPALHELIKQLHINVVVVFNTPAFGEIPFAF
jgi:hypothetical protein